MASCRSCGADIYWAETKGGRKMPVDREPVEGGNVELDQRIDPEGGEWKFYATVLREGDTLPLMPAYVSHFSTCPNAKDHRRR